MSRFYFMTIRDENEQAKDTTNILSDVHPLDKLSELHRAWGFSFLLLFWKEIDEELYYKYKERYTDGQ